MLAYKGVRTLIFGGIVTNSGIASTAHNMHVRYF